MPFRIGFISSGSGLLSFELIKLFFRFSSANANNIEEAFVFCNRERAEDNQSDRFINRAEELFGSHCRCFSYKKFMNTKADTESKRDKSNQDLKKSYDQGMLTILEQFNPDLLMMADYDNVIGKNLCQKYNFFNFRLNPGYTTAQSMENSIWSLIEERATEAELECYLLEESLDKGVPIAYTQVSLMGESFEWLDYDKLWLNVAKKLKQKTVPQIREEEGRGNKLFSRIERSCTLKTIAMFMQTLKYFVEGRLKIVDKTITMDGRILEKPLCYDQFIKNFESMVRLP